MKHSFTLTFLLLLSAVLRAQTPPTLNSYLYANSNQEAYTTDVSHDAAGNVYVTGYFLDALTVGGNTYTDPVNAYDSYLAKVDAGGTVVWFQQISGTGMSQMYSVATDAAGYSYVIGRFESTLAVGTQTLGAPGHYNTCLLKFSPTGGLVWMKSWGGPNGDQGNDVALDDGGNVVFTGFQNGTAVYDAVSVPSTGQNDAFVGRADTAGNVLWVIAEGGSSGDEGYSLAAGYNGKIAVTGIFSGTGNFSGTNLASGGNFDAFVVQYDTSGNLDWARRCGGTTADYGYDVTLAASGQVFACGYYSSPSFTSNGSPLSNAGNWDAFIISYSTTGTQSFVKRIGTAGYDYAYTLQDAGSGNPIVSGGFGGNVTVDGNSLVNSAAGFEDLFLIRLNAAGTAVWAVDEASTSYIWGEDIDLHSDGRLTVATGFDGTTAMGPSAASNQYDGLVLNYCLRPTAIAAVQTNGLDLTTTDSSLEATGWNWNFGDGNSASTASPVHTYSTSGTYTVTLIVSNACGNDTLIQQVTVGCSAPVAAFSFAANDTVLDFTDLSNPVPTAWTWDFGDGGSSSLQNPQHVYDSAGTYTVTLIVADACGMDTLSQVITVTCPLPMAVIDADTVDWYQELYQLNAPGGAGNTYFWDFGDGDTSTLQNPVHDFPFGFYDVVLTVSNACGSATDSLNLNTGWESRAESFGIPMQLSPNPGANELSVQTLLPRGGTAQVYAWTVTGQRLLLWEGAVQAGPWTQQVNTASLPAGAYGIQFVLENEPLAHKTWLKR